MLDRNYSRILKLPFSRFRIHRNNWMREIESSRFRKIFMEGDCRRMTLQPTPKILTSGPPQKLNLQKPTNLPYLSIPVATLIGHRFARDRLAQRSVDTCGTFHVYEPDSLCRPIPLEYRIVRKLPCTPTAHSDEQDHESFWTDRLEFWAGCRSTIRKT